MLVCFFWGIDYFFCNFGSYYSGLASVLKLKILEILSNMPELVVT